MGPLILGVVSRLVLRKTGPGRSGLRRRGRTHLPTVKLGSQAMYAVIKTGGKQYRVATDDVLTIEKIEGETGATIEFAEVLMLGGAGDPTVGAPAVLGAKVVAEVV